MSDDTKKLPGRPRSLQSHQAILKATLELLGEVGFDGLSIDAIASRARVGKMTIYRRYEYEGRISCGCHRKYSRRNSHT